METYFTHDAHALEDPKCMLLVSQLGMEGYGMFWALIEILRLQPDYRLPVAMIPALAGKLGVSEAKLRTVIGNYGLFVVQDDTIFFSESLNRRMEALEQAATFRRERALKAAKGRWNKALPAEESCSSNAQAMLKQCYSNAQAYEPDSQVVNLTPGGAKIKNVPSNNIINNNLSSLGGIVIGGIGGKRKGGDTFKIPSVDEVEAYIREKGYDVNAEAFCAFYESNGWKVGRNPMRNWKQAVVTWQYRDRGGRIYGKQEKTTSNIYDGCLR